MFAPRSRHRECTAYLSGYSRIKHKAQGINLSRWSVVSAVGSLQRAAGGTACLCYSDESGERGRKYLPVADLTGSGGRRDRSPGGWIALDFAVRSGSMDGRLGFYRVASVSVRVCLGLGLGLGAWASRPVRCRFACGLAGRHHGWT